MIDKLIDNDKKQYQTLPEKLYNRVSNYVSLRIITPSNLEISGIIFPPII